MSLLESSIYAEKYRLLYKLRVIIRAIVTRFCQTYTCPMRIVHLDIDKNFYPLISGEKYPFSVSEIKKVPKYSQIQGLTIKSQSKVNSKILSDLPNLKLLVTRTVGTDHINLDSCKKKNIAVYYLVDYGAFNIAEHTFALLLSGTRRIIDSQKEIKKGQFSYQNFLGFSLKGKTLGIIGTGRIGLEVIKLANAFGLKVVAYDVVKTREQGFKYVSLDELLSRSDVISLHVPLLPQTKYLINQAAIKKMKNGVILLNAARGELIKTADLIKNIKKFRFVGLDVLENETKFSKNHPLLKFANVLITPHLAFFTDASIKIIAQETQKCIENFVARDKTGRVV